MNKIKKSLMAMMILIGTCVAPVAALQSMGQELTDANGNAVSQDASQSKSSGGFYEIVFGSGIVGTILWFTLFGDGALAIYFCVDCSIMIKPEKLMPKKLIDQVQRAMAEGDIVAAMTACENTPSVMSNILLAAFQHVEEGFDVIQEAVTAASDLEQEKLGQRLNWISVCSNLGPSLGLLGTVQGMILTFQALASGGAGDASALANSIGQALWTTAGGLIVSIPSLTAFYSLRNNANRLILRMTAVTMEFLNGLRNVEVGAGEEVMEEVPEMA
ncbi:MAG: MotA/TolQ/ExbB proton channel family protein [Kiritimatiellae bacterium]|nr:MotA/TolQ/ExbB proton channel family protein [Kiritimatiellia bacterium]